LHALNRYRLLRAVRNAPIARSALNGEINRRAARVPCVSPRTRSARANHVFARDEEEVRPSATLQSSCEMMLMNPSQSLEPPWWVFLALILVPAPARAEKSDLADIQAALAADANATANAHGAQNAAPSAPVGGSAGGGVQSMNPDVSVIGDFAAAAFSRRQNHETGAHDPVENGFNLQQLELSLSSVVDPYFRFDSHLVFARDGFELEEAYGTTLALPARLQARFGQFLTRFGRLNASHPHTWDFVDQPFALGRIFGGDGNRGLGVELSMLLPLPWYVELVASATRADGAETARSFFGSENPGVHDPLDLLYVAAAKQFFPLSDDWSLLFGTSVALGPNPTGSERLTEVYGADAYLKYRPVGQQSFTELALQSEWFYRRRDIAGSVLSDVNSYFQVVYRFAQRFSAGCRYEYGSAAYDASGRSVVDPLDPTWTRTRTRMSAALTHYPTEFSRFRLQVSRDAGLGPSVWALFLAAEVAVGAHGAHPF
jgi:hypothetical protein